MRKLYFLFLGIFLLFVQEGFSQSPLSGTVKESDGSPVVGASVKVKSSKVGTITDANGNFTLNVKPGQILVISAIGYTEAEYDAKPGMSISLSQDVQSMSEVIVTGVAGATTRKKMTVSVTKIGEERLSVVPATSAASALTGKVAGVRVSSASGSPGGGIDLQLRGDNNLNGSSSPLILVDGVILNGSLTDINVDDVESMEVVKGAAAASLYGSRAGNGVISITTKRGNRIDMNSTKITIRNEVGFQNLQSTLDLATHHPYQLADDWQSFTGQYTKYKTVTYPAGYLGGFSPDITGSRKIDPDHYMDNPFGVNIDQQKEFFKTGTNYTNHVGLSTRSKNTNIYTSFENNSQGGIIQNTNGYERQNYRFNLDHKITSWLKLSTSNLFINTKTQYPGDGGGIFFNIVLAEPDNNLKLANPDGQPYYIRHNHWSNERNPLYSTWKNDRADFTRRWIGNYAANIKLAKWINIDASHSIENENYRYTSDNPYDTWVVGGSSPYGITYSKGSLYKYSSEAISQNSQFTINMSHKLGDLGIQSKLSYLNEDKHYENYEASGSQYAVRDLPTLENFANPTLINIGSYQEDVRAKNYFAIVGLDYKGKYLMDAMYRYDGSSLFGSEQRWHSYYRVSGAYRISEDVKIPGIEELKVRAAYGTAGLRPGFNWQYETYGINNGLTSPSQKGNVNLKPSQTAEKEIGLNVEFLKKFYFEGTYAKSTTSDQFLNVPLIPFLNDGFTSQWQNSGTLDSKTLELTLGAKWIQKKDFNWNSNLVFSKVKQTISKLDIPPYQAGPDGLFYIREGETYGAIYGYTWVKSLDVMAKQLPAGKAIGDYEVNSDGFVVDKGSQGKASEKPIKLKDANGADAFIKIGDGLPDFNLGFANTVSYKGLSLYVLIDVKKGGDVYNRKSQWLTRDSRNGIMDMFGVPDNQKKTYDYYQAFYDVNSNNSYWVEDAGFLKFREVSLGYNFPESMLRSFKGVVKGINAKIIGRNLLTFTDYSGYDAEVGSIRNPFDGTGTYPNFRNIAFSLSLDF